MCNSPSEIGQEGDAVQVRCPRCGPFVVSGTALAMLPSRLETTTRAVARASHAIRSKTSEEKWLRIDSTNVDEIVALPLPAPEQQLAALMCHIRNQAGDAHFASVPIGDLDTLAAIVGAADSGALMRLVQWAAQEGLLEVDAGGKTVMLAPKVWLTASSEREVRREPITKVHQDEIKIIKGYCPTCGPDRRAEIKASYRERTDDDEAPVWVIDTYNILKCGGCETIYVQHVRLFSEDTDYQQTPNGEWEEVAIPKVAYWPAPAKRVRPDWLIKLEDQALRTVFTEVYGALDADQRILAAIGARTTLDRAMVLLGAAADSFPGKLKELEDKGIVSPHENGSLARLNGRWQCVRAPCVASNAAKHRDDHVRD